MIKQVVTEVHRTMEYAYMYQAWDNYIQDLTKTHGIVKSSDPATGTYLNTWYSTVTVRGMVKSFSITKHTTDAATLFTIATIDYICE